MLKTDKELIKSKKGRKKKEQEANSCKNCSLHWKRKGRNGRTSSSPFEKGLLSEKDNF